jgi:hypothetical protein
MSAPSLSICFHIPTVELGSEGPSLSPSNHKKKKRSRQEPGNYYIKTQNLKQMWSIDHIQGHKGKKQKAPIQETDKNRC